MQARRRIDDPSEAARSKTGLHFIELILIHDGLLVVKIHCCEADAFCRVVIFLALELQGPIVSAIRGDADVNNSIVDVREVRVEWRA